MITDNSPSQWPSIWIAQVEAYSAVAMACLVLYDYVFHIHEEVEFIWKKRLSSITMLYMVLRYVGIFYAMVYMCFYISIPLGDTACHVLFGLMEATQLIAVFSLQVMMVVRVCALYNGSKKIQWTLFSLLAIEYVTIVALVSISLTGPGATVDEYDWSGIRHCMNHISSNSVGNWGAPLRFSLMITFEFLLVVLTLWRFYGHIMDSKAHAIMSKCADRFLVLLVRDNVVYFVLAFVGIGSNAVAFAPSLEEPSLGTAVFCVFNIILYNGVITMIGPWMILNIRRQDARDMRGETTLNMHLGSLRFAESSGATVTEA